MHNVATKLGEPFDLFRVYLVFLICLISCAFQEGSYVQDFFRLHTLRRAMSKISALELSLLVLGRVHRGVPWSNRISRICSRICLFHLANMTGHKF